MAAPLKGNYYWRYTHFCNFHDSGRKGKPQFKNRTPFGEVRSAEEVSVPFCSVLTGKKAASTKLVCDFEDSEVLNRSSFSRKMDHHPWPLRSPNITGFLLLPMSASEQ